MTQRETLLPQEKEFVASFLNISPDLLEHGEWREALEWEQKVSLLQCNYAHDMISTPVCWGSLLPQKHPLCLGAMRVSLYGPIRGQYCGHGIYIDQSEARVEQRLRNVMIIRESAPAIYVTGRHMQQHGSYLQREDEIRSFSNVYSSNSSASTLNGLLKDVRTDVSV